MRNPNTNIYLNILTNPLMISSHASTGLSVYLAQACSNFCCIGDILIVACPDPHLKVRLIASRASGHTQIFSLSRPSGSPSWQLDGPVETDTITHPLSRGSFILDANTGISIKADRSHLAASLRVSDHHYVPCLWVTAGAKGVRCIADITGERVGKADWSSKLGGVESVHIIEKSG
jgi:syntaxin-binding protein 5